MAAGSQSETGLCRVLIRPGTRTVLPGSGVSSRDEARTAAVQWSAVQCSGSQREPTKVGVGLCPAGPVIDHHHTDAVPQRSVDSVGGFSLRAERFSCSHWRAHAAARAWGDERALRGVRAMRKTQKLQGGVHFSPFPCACLSRPQSSVDAERQLWLCREGEEPRPRCSGRLREGSAHDMHASSTADGLQPGCYLVPVCAESRESVNFTPSMQNHVCQPTCTS